MDIKELTIPCAYQGGKQRLAKQIVDIIFEQNEINDDTKFYDLCCGSGAISIELVKRGINPRQITMVDKSPWGLFWRKIGDGTFSTDVFKFYIDDVPKDINEIQPYIKEMSKQPANDGLFDNAVYKYLLLQASSFGSKAIWLNDDNKWATCSFRSYWLPTETSSRRSPVNPMMPMPDTLFNRVEQLYYYMEGVHGINGDVMDIVSPPDNSIIYIDPPYKDTAGYGFSFDVSSLINQLKLGIKLHNKKVNIYVSEGYKMTDESHLLSKGRSKGGVSGERSKANEEWLNIFK
ncbi:DNA adenine methylase [Ureibacillus chungkukjangi]|uniref:DNA adenine methylase n=1 Tax=Ureibacillus chungkukjangi TaxID=1202712 RepID=UPI00203BF087|nr:DNA adenine methylase [Ureibacillus chungkukjangi]MCM3387207.1 DNA adenine methylase [Ureibacillus chungkukjangi]